jgi:hypothetical protein
MIDKIAVVCYNQSQKIMTVASSTSSGCHPAASAGQESTLNYCSWSSPYTWRFS